MTGRIRINEDNIFPRLVAGSLIMSGVVGAATALLVSPRFGISLLAGGVLATANFVWLRRGLEASLRLTPGIASRFATLRFLLRLAIMALLLYVVIVRLGADIFGLLLGLSVLVINITIFSIYLSTRKGG
jgi:asparagine N-glycosylation enzyme membrane subunit Stt3